MIAITERQREVLEFVKRYLREHHYPPTFREISRGFGISVKGAYDHIKALERKGYVGLNHHRSRTIEVLERPGDEPDAQPDENEVIGVPLLGNVAAGKPLFAEENHEGTVPVPRQFLGSGEYFALHVRGDSMQDAGIHDQDIALFRAQPTANNGDIVVALVDDSVTLKRFYREKNRIRLKSENPDYPSIYTREVRVLGKLAHLMRTYE